MSALYLNTENSKDSPVLTEPTLKLVLFTKDYSRSCELEKHSSFYIPDSILNLSQLNRTLYKLSLAIPPRVETISHIYNMYT